MAAIKDMIRKGVAENMVEIKMEKDCLTESRIFSKVYRASMVDLKYPTGLISFQGQWRYSGPT